MACRRTQATGTKLLPKCSAESDGLRSECMVFQSIRERGLRVAEYRAFSVGRDGLFFNCEPLICADDAEAIVLASRLVGIRDVELWSGDRLVIRLTRTTD
jgi:hypothetical protein